MIKEADEKSLSRLRDLLEQTDKWPLRYMFKFIVPNNNSKVDSVVALMPQGGRTSFNCSKDLHYVSVTHVADMHSADDIVAVVRSATSINGVISL